MFQTATRYTNPEIHHLSRYCLNKLSTWTARGIGPEGALPLSLLCCVAITSPLSLLSPPFLS